MNESLSKYLFCIATSEWLEMVLNLKGHQIAFLMGGLCLLVSLHREGSAPDVCTAGLFVAAASVVLKAVVS